MPGDRNCHLHPACSSTSVIFFCKNYHPLKDHDAMNSKVLRKCITDTYQEDPEGSFHHFFLSPYVPWIAGDKRYQNPQEIINRIRVEGN